MMLTQSNNFSSHDVRMMIILLLIFFTICLSQTSEAGRVLKEKDKYLLLPSLQKTPVPTPTPNPGTGARTTSVMSQITERNFAGHKETETRPPPLPSSSNITQHKVTDKAVGLLAAH
ncbi:hypothetical protein MTR67_029585 [Solanum verrucosum]|uniref:Uncharacterized protein n=1 Tax=Solanum verrucosum TaxID=315347 RepID=A0AAF0R8D6_SOLVR|nr:hypothetical protein MTR67_029585 [Solanum verrucosum]